MLKKLLNQVSKTDSLIRTIEESISNNKFLHIVSLNPENAVAAYHKREFWGVYFHPDSVVVADGVGIVFASKILGKESVKRVTGVDLMVDMVKRCRGKRIVFVGGMGGVAKEVADQFSKTLENSCEYFSLPDVDKNEPELLPKILSIRPNVLFLAFGSPDQELWIEKNKSNLHGIVCMGVGGGFDFVSGKVARAPMMIRRIGLEWLFRLMLQPWRMGRQAKLLEFIWLIILAKTGLLKND